MNTLLFIPTYNDNKYFYLLIKELRKHYHGPVLCVDDNSTYKVLNKYSDNNLKILYNQINKGKGYSIIKAANYALKQNFTHLLVIDSDLQHDPSKINDFIQKNKNVDIVYGKRDFFNKMPLSRILSNMLTSFILSIKCKRIIYDTQCGYRRYNLNIFKNNNFLNMGYQLESEILIKSINKDTKLDFVIIPTIYNKNQSNMHPVYDTLKFIKLILLN